MTTAHHTGVVSGEAAPAPSPDDSGAPLLPPAAWEEAAAQLDPYFRALGLDDAERLHRLAEQVLQRLAAKPAAPEQLPQAAMAEAQGMLDEWLAQLLDLPDTHQRQQLAAARAALRFDSELADWSAAFLQKTPRPGYAPSCRRLSCHRSRRRGSGRWSCRRSISGAP